MRRYIKTISNYIQNSILSKKIEYSQVKSLMNTQYGARDGTWPSAAATPCILSAWRPKFLRISVPANRFLLKTIRRIVFLTQKPSRVQAPTFLQKIKETTQKCYLFYWCERRDLNPYGITTRPSNVRVCRFRHSRISVVLSNARRIISKEIDNVKPFLKKIKYF